MSVPKETRDAAMKAILDFERTKSPGVSISSTYLSINGLPKKADAKQTVEVLRSMGFVTYTKGPDGEIDNIQPTDSGLHYFETDADENAKTQKEFLHEWAIAIFSAIAGALLSRPLWDTIDRIIGLMNANKTPPG